MSEAPSRSILVRIDEVDEGRGLSVHVSDPGGDVELERRIARAVGEIITAIEPSLELTREVIRQPGPARPGRPVDPCPSGAHEARECETWEECIENGRLQDMGLVPAYEGPKLQAGERP